MKKYRVLVESTDVLYLDVEAESHQAAIKLAKETDGGEFTNKLESTWDIVDAVEITN